MPGTSGNATELQFDSHGIECVPVADRTSTPIQQFWLWIGAQILPVTWLAGALGPILGLSLLESVLVIAVGNVVGCALFAVMSLMGHHTGAPQMVLARLGFGRRGAYVPATMNMLFLTGWVGVITWIVADMVLGILREFDYEGGQGTRYAVAAAIMIGQVFLAVYGFYGMRTFAKYTVPVTLVLMAVMSGLAWSKTDVSWTAASVSGLDRFTAISQLMTAIGIGWGISWINLPSDYTRFVHPRYSSRKVFLGVYAGICVATVWLASLGATTAAISTEMEPAAMVAALFGFMTVPVLILLMYGPLSTNIFNIYSASMALLSLDRKIARWKVSTAVGIVASAITVYLLESPGFATAMANWLMSTILWLSAFAGVTLTDYFIVRRQIVDVPSLYRGFGRSLMEDVNAAGLIAFAAGLIAGWALQFGLVAPMQGPIARMTGGVDFSWAGGLLVSGAVYYALTVLRKPVSAERPATETPAA